MCDRTDRFFFLAQTGCRNADFRNAHFFSQLNFSDDSLRPAEPMAPCRWVGRRLSERDWGTELYRGNRYTSSNNKIYDFGGVFSPLRSMHG